MWTAKCAHYSLSGPLEVGFWKPKRVMPISTDTLIPGIWKLIIKSSVMSSLSHKHYSAATSPDSWANFWFKNSPFVQSCIPWYCERGRIRRHCWNTSQITLELWHSFTRRNRRCGPSDLERTVSCVRENAHLGNCFVEFPELSCMWEWCKHFWDLESSPHTLSGFASPHFQTEICTVALGEAQ